MLTMHSANIASRNTIYMKCLLVRKRDLVRKKDLWGSVLMASRDLLLFIFKSDDILLKLISRLSMFRQ